MWRLGFAKYRWNPAGAAINMSTILVLPDLGKIWQTLVAFPKVLPVS
jgi:hypothetical protein